LNLVKVGELDRQDLCYFRCRFERWKVDKKQTYM